MLPIYYPYIYDMIFPYLSFVFLCSSGFLMAPSQEMPGRVLILKEFGVGNLPAGNAAARAWDLGHSIFGVQHFDPQLLGDLKTLPSCCPKMTSQFATATPSLGFHSPM